MKIVKQLKPKTAPTPRAVGSQQVRPILNIFTRFWEKP